MDAHPNVNPNAKWSITRDGGRITVVGDITSFNRSTVKELALDALAAGERAIVLDLSQVGTVDTPGIAVFYTIVARCRSLGATLEFAGLTDELREYLERTKVLDHQGGTAGGAS